MRSPSHHADRLLNPLRHAKHGLQRHARNVLLGVCESIVKRKLRSTVASGIFQGVHYDGQHIYGAPMAKLLGTYEKELHHALTLILAGGFDRLINVGGAEGYYPLGLVRNWGIREAVVFEMDPRGRTIIEKLARENAIAENIKVFGKCEEQDLYGVLGAERRNLLIMDVEGSELDLLSPRVLCNASNSALVIEAHDFIVPDCTPMLCRLLRESHDIEVITSSQRTVGDFPYPSRIPARAKLAFLDEGRPGRMNWVLATPKHVASIGRKPDGA